MTGYVGVLAICIYQSRPVSYYPIGVMLRLTLLALIVVDG